MKVCLSILNSLLQNGAEIGILKCGKREEKIRCINSNRFQYEEIDEVVDIERVVRLTETRL